MSRIWERKFRSREGARERGSERKKEYSKSPALPLSRSPALPLPRSPAPSLSRSLALPLSRSLALRVVVFGRSFAELDRLLAAFAGAGCVRGDIATVAKIIEVVQFAVAPGLKFDDFDEVCGGEDSGGDL